MLLLLLIIVLFLILTIMWYLLVRDIVFEDFNSEENLDEAEGEEDTEESSTEMSDQVPTINSDDSYEITPDNMKIDSQNFICLLNQGRYLTAKSRTELGLGPKSSRAIFKIHDKKGDSIQLESLKYPDCYLYYDVKPVLKQAKYSPRTFFTPIGSQSDKKIVLQYSNKPYCLTNQSGEIIFSKENSNNRRTQTFLVERAHVGERHSPP